MMRASAAAVALLLAVPLPPLAAQAAARGPAPVVRGALGARADSILRAAAADGFSGVALVSRDGEVILEKGYGLADRAAGTPMTGGTVVQIASNTKDFTTVAILQLHERGRIDVHDPITRYLEDVPADKRSITLWQLLDHRAGFDLHLGGDFEVVSREEMVRRALSSRLLFAPDERRSYSNIGYNLLAAVVEKVTGRSFDAYVRENILRPLELRNTGHVNAPFAPARLARGYQGDQDRGTMAERPHASDGPYWNLRGSGGMLSTVSDMHRFYQALFTTDRLLKPETRALRFRPQEPQMMAGSDMVIFFMYNREPATGLDIILASNVAEMPARRVHPQLAAALGVAGPGGPGQQVEISGSPAPGGRREMVAAGGSPGQSSPGASTRIPDTPAGRAARAYIATFNQGDPDATRRLYLERVATDPQDTRTLDQRVQGALRLYRELGFLTPVAAVSSSPTRLVLTVRSVQKGELSMIFDVEPAEPFRLTSVQVAEESVER